MKITNKQQKELGFNPFNKSEYEFVHWSEEIAFNSKDDTVYEFCEVDGIGKSIVKVKNYDELKDLIKNVLFL